MKNRFPMLSIALLLSSAYVVADEKYIHKEETVIENDTNKTQVVTIKEKEKQGRPGVLHQVGDTLHTQADKARAIAHNAADEVEYGAHVASDKAKEIGHKAADAAKEAGHTVKEVAIKAKEKAVQAEEKAEGYGRKALNVAKTAGSKVTDVAKGAGTKVANAALYAYHKAGDAVEAIGDKIHTATHHQHVRVHQHKDLLVNSTQPEPINHVNDNMVRVAHDTSTQQHTVIQENHVHETCNSPQVCN